MQLQVRSSSCLVAPAATHRSRAPFSARNFAAAVLLAALAATGPALQAQIANRITQPVDRSQVEPLANHLPLWASQANSIGQVPAAQQLDQFTLVLARSQQQQAAFDQFVADQQNPASPEYHHWLTPDEVGARFGLSDQDIATLNSWLQSQSLHVNWVAPSKMFIGFGGTATDVGRAFGTTLNYYMVNGVKRLSVSSDPEIPAAVAPAVKSIRGLFTVDEQPNHRVSTAALPSPQFTNSGNHYITPADFNKIYDVPGSLTGAGVTIGIVSWSRTNFADFTNFRSKTAVSFPNPTEVVPTAYGGIDPGAAYTAPPTGSVSLGGQEEATLDVIRAGSVAPTANLLLVVSSSAGSNDGIGADAQYIVNTNAAQVMTISFGACESAAGSSNVAFWDTLFQSAAAEGISVFVSSGDSGAAGCDTAFAAPPTIAKANSPNYICSSSYATCVGGTQFIDTASPSTYWSSTNSTGYLSALSYIPEGAWNEPLDTSVTPNTAMIAGTGGGVSTIISTPTWQTGTGVPSARSGRYTPDVSFSAAGHDAYFACMAAMNADCTTYFTAFEGTSAAAPGMAGVAALLDQKLGSAQGNLNPHLYPLATSAPSAFHDATVATSGVSGCSLTTASVCNNSVPTTSGTAQSGYQLQTGYDEATGLGSLDVAVFLNSYGSTSTLPVVTTGAASAITTTTATIAGTVNPNGLDTNIWFLYGTSSNLSGASQTTSQDLGSGSSASAATANLTGLTAGATYYFQLVAQNSTGASNGSIQSFATNSIAKTTPTITWATPAAINYGTALSATQLNATASVPGIFVYSPAAGAVLTAGTQTLSVAFTPTDTTTYNAASATVTLTINKVTPTITWATPAAITNGTALSATQLNATASVPGTFVYSPAAGTVLAVGSHTLSVAFTPTDATDYNTASATVTLTVKASPTITWATPAAINYGTALSATQLNATASVPGTFVYSPAAGAVLNAGTQTLSTTFTPTDTATYGAVTATVSLTVNKVTPTITWATPAAINYGTALSATQLNATASVPGTFSYSPAAGSVLAAGAKILTVTFLATDQADYGAATATVTLTVNQAVPAITWATPSAVAVGTVLSATQLNATASVPGSFVYSPALGTAITTAGTTTLSTTFTPTDITDYASATASVSLSVVPGFSVAGTAVTVTAGATTSNTSTVTVTPTAGFTGSVALTAAITASPSGATNTPTVSFGSTTPVSITSTTAGTATLTVTTTASKSSCSASNQAPTGIPWYAKGGAVLACVLLFGIAPKRRKWRTMLGMLLLFVALASGMMACGSGSTSTACNNVVTGGTTTGNYTITITGTGPSGTPAATSTVTLTVN